MKRPQQQFLSTLLTFALWTGVLWGQQPAPVPQAAPPAAGDNANISLHLPGADLLQVVSVIAGELKMNYVVDPGVKGTITINTMGEVKRSDLLPLLQAILRVNGATAVESNGLWRIMAIKDASRAPISPTMDGRAFPADDRMVLNVVPLRYAAASDLSKLLANYLSDAGSIVAHEQGNILLITDSSRSMARLMEVIALFDSDNFAGQRVRMFQAKNSSATGLAADLQSVFSAYALTGKSPLQFLPVERLNGVLVVSPNPSAFAEVEKWVEKLDVATRTGGLRNYVYKVQNAHAEDLAGVLIQLYGGYGANQQLQQQRGGRGSRGGGGSGGAGAVGVQNQSSTPGTPTQQFVQQQASQGQLPGNVPLGAAPTPLAGTRQAGGSGDYNQGPRIVSDNVNNMIIVQATPPEWSEIRATIQELDIVPRQVLIEAQIFEVNLTGELQAGVTAFLQQRSNANRTLTAGFAPTTASGATPVLTAAVGELVGHTRELLLFLNAVENRGRTKVISAPSIMASDNMDAKIQVGATVPTLTSQGFTGAQQQGGGSIFTNGVSNVDTGVILQVTPRINAGGLVTLQISQEVSVPGKPPTDAIQSPTIQKRTVSTQVTIQDGETIALGGIIQETNTVSKSRIPLLGDIPYLGAFFGNTTTTHDRTELIVLLTPHVVRDMNEAFDVTEELKHKLKGLRQMMRQEQ